MTHEADRAFDVELLLTLACSCGLRTGPRACRLRWPSQRAVQEPARARKRSPMPRQVSRIVQDKCQTCHHPGTSAPFTLATYDDAVHWADTIREVVTDNRMPPWHADPRYGTFSNDRRLPKEEKEEILAWLDTGMPLGDKKDLPAPRDVCRRLGHRQTRRDFRIAGGANRPGHRRRPLPIFRDADQLQRRRVDPSGRSPAGKPRRGAPHHRVLSRSQDRRAVRTAAASAMDSSSARRPATCP